MLVIQFPPEHAQNYERVIDRYDRIIEIENTLIRGFSHNGEAIVDGHDFGEFANIFIFPTGSWKACIEIAMAYLTMKNALKEVVVIKRLTNGKYQVIWPKDFSGDFERV